MCLVEVEKMPKLMAACTLPVAEGMVVRTETPQVAAARKSMLEFLLTNHPLDCPVCDKGGECELQDMVFRYGAGESRFTETKVHVDEKQWSPVVFFDGPRCILCYPLRAHLQRRHGRGRAGRRSIAAWSPRSRPTTAITWSATSAACASTSARWARSPAAPIAIKTRPWEMEHVGTICTHCSNGCKTTLGVRNDEIIRGNNRDRSGINGEFLCIKGRYAFDFYNHPERLQAPLMRVNGKLEAGFVVEGAGDGGGEVQRSPRRAAASSASSGRTTPPTKRITTCRSSRARCWGRATSIITARATCSTLLDALSGKTGKLATTADLYRTKAVLVIGRGSGAGAAVPVVPDSRQLPASPGARLCGDAGAGARG